MDLRRLSIPLAALLAALTPAAAQVVSAPGAGTAATALAVGEVDVEVTDAFGGPRLELRPDDLTVRVGEESRPVLEVGPEARPWRVVVYLDAGLSSVGGLPRAAAALARLAPELARLGPVEVVLAAERPRHVAGPSRDPAELAAGLERAAVMERGEDRLLALRREAQEALPPAPQSPDGVVDEATAREAAYVRDRLDLFLDTLTAAAGEGGDAPPEGPAVVFWVGDGYDLDPAAPWRRLGVEPVARTAPPPGVPLDGPTGELAAALAALGWTVVPVSLAGDRAAEPSRWGSTERDDPMLGGTDVLGTYRVPRRRTPAEKAEEELARERPAPVAAAPRAPLERVAAETGGRVVLAAAELPAAVAELGRRLRVRYAARPDPAAGMRPLAVAGARPDVRVSARRWTASGTPEPLSALRARRLLAGELDPGLVSVRAVVAPPSAGAAAGTIEVRMEPPPGGPVRLTLALPAAVESAPPEVSHRSVTGEVVRPSGAAVGRPTWSYRGSLAVGAEVDRVGVVVEDLSSGAWGGTVAGLSAEPSTGGGLYDAAAGVLPAPRPVQLLRPPGRMLRGPVRFETVVDPRVARVVLALDGRRVARIAAAPFAAVVDLGRLPLPRRVEAIAYDAAGGELGRDTLVVNGGARAPTVRITEPTGRRAVGDVTVGAEVALPTGRRLDRLELYWNDRLVATLFQPPFRHRLRIPPQAAEGILRAVAVLADGSRVEDALALNGTLPPERVDVRLTELFVVVTDRDGRPVRGLGRDDFQVREEGVPQRIATFGDAAEMPLTVGLAVDSSASMFVKLPAVTAAARGFLGGLRPGRDQAFVVDFDDEARLVAGPTQDLGRLRRSFATLTADGRTSLWKAVVYALVQLQSSPGRRALIVYSDGADQDADFSFRTCLDFARRVGVPVYVLVANEEAARLGGLDFGWPSFGSRLDRLTAATGGRSWIVRRHDDLSGIYRQIEDELAAQYLIGYYPQAGGDAAWRRVEVAVRRRGLTARTVAGYEP